MRLHYALVAMFVIAAAALTGCGSARSYQNRLAAEDHLAKAAEAAEDGDSATAERLYALAARTAPDVPSVQARVGIGYMMMEPSRARLAWPHLSKALKADPGQPWPVHESAVRAAIELGHEAELRKLVPEIAKRFNDDAWALNNVGYSLADADVLVKEALPMLERAVELMPDEGAIIDSLGWAYYRLGDYPKAIEMLERANDLEPEEPELQYHLGAAYAAAGRAQDARRMLRDSLEGDPGNDDARQALRNLTPAEAD